MWSTTTEAKSTENMGMGQNWVPQLLDGLILTHTHMNQLICAAGTCRTQQQARKHRVSPGPATVV